MRGPLARLSERFGRRRAPSPAPPAAPTLRADMDRGAAAMQRRLEDARSRLKATTPPLPEDDA